VSVLAFFWAREFWLTLWGYGLTGIYVMTWYYGDTNYDAYVTRRYIIEMVYRLLVGWDGMERKGIRTMCIG
jgi:hypothetical protein